MERATVFVIIFMCVLLCEHQRVFGTDVDMRVKAGENITLYCDLVIPLGSIATWIRTCSHENQPSLIIDPPASFTIMFPRFSLVPNSSSNSADLHIKNVSVSDEGIYHCAKGERKIHKDDNGIKTSYEYVYGNKRTRLSVLEVLSREFTTITPVSDCVFCWTLLFSVCPVCVLLSSLLSSICVYCFCRPQTTAQSFQADCVEKHECETSKTGKICAHTEVSYRLLSSPHPYGKI